MATGGSAEIHDRTGLYIAIVALAMAGMGLGYEMAQTSSRADIRELQEQKLQAQIQAAVSKAEATAHDADVNARAALYNVQKICADVRTHDGMKNLDCH